jgi:membrane associated rhomboid family serine protease
MIPLSDQPREPRRLVPIVMWTIVALNVLVFVYMELLQLALGPGILPTIYQDLGVVPYYVTHDVSPPGTPSPIYLTIFTAMFVHGGWLHIGGNMLYLWIFGDNVESAMGHLRFLLFYLICGVAAALAQIAVDPSSRVPAIGASGAIAGVLAAYALFYPQARVKTLIFLGIFITITTISALLLIGFWILIQVVSGLTELGASQSGGVAYFAHIGGFFVGLLLANLFRARPSQAW